MPNSWLSNSPFPATRIKYVCSTSFSGGTPDTNNSSYWNNGTIPWIASGELQNCDVNKATSYITTKGLSNSSARIIRKNSVAVAMTGATCANVGYMTFETSANQSVYSYIIKSTQNSRFMYYSLIAMRDEILSKQNGGAQAGINGAVCKNLYIPKIDTRKQQQIADYLDKKVGVIDKLITNISQQVEELRLFKFSVISEYVSSQKLNKYKIKYKTNIVDKKSEFDGQPYFALENIISDSGKYMDSDAEYSTKGATVCKEGDICFGKLRPYLRKYYFVTQNTTCSTEFAVFREKNPTKYMYYIIQSEEFLQLCNAFSEGTKMPRINIEKLKNWKFGFPSVEEQKKFAEHMDSISTKVERLIQIKQLKLFELKEYKKSLIYECVTGKKEVSQ